MSLVEIEKCLRKGLVDGQKDARWIYSYVAECIESLLALPTSTEQLDLITRFLKPLVESYRRTRDDQDDARYFVESA